MTGPIKIRIHNGKVHTLATVSANPYKLYDYGYDALVVSEGHARRGSGWSGGGPFLQFTERRKHGTLTLPSEKLWKQYPNIGYLKGTRKLAPSGLLNQNPFPPFTAPPPGSILSELVPWGSKGWNAAKPGKPTADLIVAGAELLREGIPSIPGNLLRRLRNIRSVGGEYLNWNFGWAPLLSDIRKMYETYQSLNRQLDQIVRDNGHGIRRRRSLGNRTETTIKQSFTSSTTSGCWLPVVSGGGYSGPATHQQVVKTTERIWFAGRFRYYIPDIGTDQWTRRATRALYGLNPSPEAIWALLPWSWLIDWFTNVGDVIGNLSNHAAENLTADYAFVMRTKGSSEYRASTFDWTGTTPAEERQGYVPIGPGSGSAMTVHETIEKARIAATPYGFGVTYDGLSTYQTSILAALGISRARF